ncbi:dsRBD fold-containing protein [Amycolatopsis samaneae]|uniref:DsRBD fold-containing protein n=1 Tax=Amycolatopsis samaneae TaxID=664691 RepID=A0ABW5GRB3_9PSEU
MREKRWKVDIFIDEHEARTRAVARLENPDHTGLVGTGLARLSPRDTDVPEIGDELAAARALADLAHGLLEAAATDIEGVTAEPAHLRE